MLIQLQQPTLLVYFYRGPNPECFLRIDSFNSESSFGKQVADQSLINSCKLDRIVPRPQLLRGPVRIKPRRMFLKSVFRQPILLFLYMPACEGKGTGSSNRAAIQERLWGEGCSVEKLWMLWVWSRPASVIRVHILAIYHCSLLQVSTSEGS